MLSDVTSAEKQVCVGKNHRFVQPDQVAAGGKVEYPERTRDGKPLASCHGHAITIIHQWRLALSLSSVSFLYASATQEATR